MSRALQVQTVGALSQHMQLANQLLSLQSDSHGLLSAAAVVLRLVGIAHRVNLHSLAQASSISATLIAEDPLSTLLRTALHTILAHLDATATTLRAACHLCAHEAHALGWPLPILHTALRSAIAGRLLGALLLLLLPLPELLQASRGIRGPPAGG